MLVSLICINQTNKTKEDEKQGNEAKGGHILLLICESKKKSNFIISLMKENAQSFKIN